MKLTLMIIFPAVVCLLFGYWYGRNSTKKPDGIFHVNTTDPNKDVFTLELLIPVALIPAKKKLIFKISNEGSQEKPLA